MQKQMRIASFVPMHFSGAGGIQFRPTQPAKKSRTAVHTTLTIAYTAPRVQMIIAPLVKLIARVTHGLGLAATEHDLEIDGLQAL
jgi:hypothetical protein